MSKREYQNVKKRAEQQARKNRRKSKRAMMFA